MDNLVIIMVMLVCVVIFTPFVLFFSSAKVAKTDDSEPEVTHTGKIIEKTSDETGSRAFGVTLQIDWIILEKEDGSRIRLRNVRTQEIMLSVGDVGTATVRGQTIYSFTRNA
ncbi:MAG: hypothetical protein IJX52_04940 [Oscillibacter sp.]|nr:hypothetical protein [Oscillibacter sp.]